jgi:hypothetical protein
MPEDVFRQEYMAEFLEDSAGVFRGVDGVIRPAGVAPVVSGQILIGLDLAKYTDWTVLVAMDAETGACLDMDRFNQLDWTIQKERIIAFCRRWRGRLVMDATGLGDPIYDDLRPALSNIEGFRITGVNKPALIQRLAVAVEQRQISIPADWTVLLNELRRYEYSFTPSGGVQYGAPSGSHDDCVIALALANHRRVGGTGGGLMARLPPPAGTILRPPPAIYVPAEASPRLARPLVRRPAILS